MIKKLGCAAAFAIVAGLTSVPVAHAESSSCSPIGGVAVPNFFGEGEGNPIIISATLTGSVTNAAGAASAIANSTAAAAAATRASRGNP